MTGMWLPLRIPLPVGAASALEASRDGTLYVASANVLLASVGGGPFELLLRLPFSGATAMSLSPAEDGLWVAHGNALALLNLSSRALVDGAAPDAPGPISALVSTATLSMVCLYRLCRVLCTNYRIS